MTRPVREALPDGLMSPDDVEDLRPSLRDADRFIASRRDPAPSSAGKRSLPHKLLDAAEVGVGAAAVGFIAGRTGSANTFGVPTGLAASTLYYITEALGYVPAKAAPHLENVIGKGGIAGFAAMWGAGQGYLMKQNAETNAASREQKPQQAKMAGIPAAAFGQGPPRHPAGQNEANEAELVAIMQRRRR